MHDEEVLALIRRQAHTERLLFSVCTGALLCGAAGVLRGRQATTHWAARPLLPSYGAVLADARVVAHGNIISAAGVTAGLDGALVLVSLLRGDAAAQEIQLAIEYAPAPVFHSREPGDRTGIGVGELSEKLRAHWGRKGGRGATPCGSSGSRGNINEPRHNSLNCFPGFRSLVYIKRKSDENPWSPRK